jgi:hypothetical protein
MGELAGAGVWFRYLPRGEFVILGANRPGCPGEAQQGDAQAAGCPCREEGQVAAGDSAACGGGVEGVVQAVGEVLDGEELGHVLQPDLRRSPAAQRFDFL